MFQRRDLSPELNRLPDAMVGCRLSIQFPLRKQLDFIEMSLGCDSQCASQP